MLLFHSLLLAASISLLSFASAYIVTTEKWEPDAPLAPGKTLFYNVIVEAQDTVVLVDIIIANGVLGNTTDIFDNSDLRKKDDANAGFTVPLVPPGNQYTVRLVETSTKRFLADSPRFEIFGQDAVAPSSASNVPATPPPSHKSTTSSTPSRSPNPSSPGAFPSSPPGSLPSSPNGPSSANGVSDSSTGASTAAPPGTSGSSPSGVSNLPTISPPPVSKAATNSLPSNVSTVETGPISSTSDAAPAGLVNRQPKSRAPIGAIAGGSAGGLAVIGLIVFFLLRRRGRSTLHTTASGTDNEKAHGLAPPGPHTVEPYILSPSSVREGAGLDGAVSLSGTDAHSTSAVPLLSKSGYRLAEASLPNGPSPQGEPIHNPGSSTNLTRVQQLRLERERINRELAALEQPPEPGYPTGSSANDASSHIPPSTAESRSNQELLLEQLAILQAQIRQQEAIQQHRESDLPPMYDGLPVPAASTPGPYVAA